MPIVSAGKARTSKHHLIKVGEKYYRLTPRQELFCRKYVEYSDATRAYKETYNSLEYSDICSYKMMSRPHIQIRIQQLMQATGFNDLSVANEHRKIITGERVDDRDKLKAIDMWYKIRGTYAPEKKEITTRKISKERQRELDNLIDIL
jgi:hypothetical protein